MGFGVCFWLNVWFGWWKRWVCMLAKDGCYWLLGFWFPSTGGASFQGNLRVVSLLWVLSRKKKECNLYSSLLKFMSPVSGGWVFVIFWHSGLVGTKEENIQEARLERTMRARKAPFFGSDSFYPAIFRFFFGSLLYLDPINLFFPVITDTSFGSP